MNDALRDMVPAPEPAPTARGSFLDLYRDHFAAMVRLAVVLTGSDAGAEDAVHDAFLRVHRRWDHVEQPTAYLRRAVVNECSSVRRRARRERELLEPQQPGVVLLHADELFDVLGRLPFRQRAALVLRYYEGLSLGEIAVVLECPEGTVASLIHRGIATLRGMIER